MANGEVHLAGNLALGVALLAGGRLIGLPLEPLALGAAFGTIITPDYDLEGKTITEDALRAIPLFGFMWQWSWYGYAMLFVHRGLSHHWLLGTLTRIGWLALLAAFWGTLLILVLQWFGWGQWNFIGVQNWYWALLAYGAWWAQDLLHYLLDL